MLQVDLHSYHPGDAFYPRMIAETEVMVLPYASAQGNSLLHALIQEFQSKQWTSFRAAIAFAKISGVYRELVDAMLQFAKSGGSIQVTFGADVFGGQSFGSDYEALKALVTAFDGIAGVAFYLYHEKGRTFHPKIYLFANEAANRALLIVGSSNWSTGGFVDNVEADVFIRLDLTENDHSACYQSMKTAFETYWTSAE